MRQSVSNKAVLCTKFAGIEDLTIGDAPPAVAGPGQVVVAVKAAGVNFADTLMVRGEYQTKPPLPFAPGLECAGIVSRIGPGVSGFNVGDRVLAMSIAGGTYAQEIAVDANMVFPIPAEMDFDVAAGFAIAYGTSYHALKSRAALQVRETLCVLGAAGGVGLTAVELGKALGARVLACASTDEKLALCRAAGADTLINYTQKNLRDEIKRLTDGKGVDVVYDPVGGELGEAALRSLAAGGRFLVIGFASGRAPQVSLNHVLIKRSAVVGVFYGNWLLTHPADAKRDLDALFALYVAGKIKPHVSDRFPMERAREALTRVTSRAVEGKVVLTM